MKPARLAQYVLVTDGFSKASCPYCDFNTKHFFSFDRHMKVVHNDLPSLGPIELALSSYGEPEEAEEEQPIVKRASIPGSKNKSKF